MGIYGKWYQTLARFGAGACHEYAGEAQLVEQRSPKPSGGSSPTSRARQYGGDRLVSLDSKTIVAIESALSRGDRVELVPVKDERVKVLRVKRRVIVGSE